jgi:uncharacterized membrane protein YphA (DoxX/SURF4 family)
MLSLIGFALSLYVGYQFLVAGEKKLSGDLTSVGGFSMIGNFFATDGNVLRRVTGFLEIMCPALLLFSSTRWAGALVLSIIMAGAVYAHVRIFKDEGGWKVPAKLLGLTLILLFI